VNIFFALFIIAWGAWVRLSGSGAGCGEHWPLCNGQVIPLSASFQTLVEYTHRLTSGVFGITILMMVFFCWKEFPKRHPARKATMFSLILTVIEALIGAVLVKKGLVDQNASELRAIVIAIHLVNTFFLMASLTLSYFFSCYFQFERIKIVGKERLIFWTACFLFLMVGASGAVTALGNTLFPESDLVAGMKNDFSLDAPFLIRLRIYHPLMAVALVALLFKQSFIWGRVELMKSATYLKPFQLLIGFALFFGFVNWLMMAPVWGALLHLLIADFLWMLFIYLAAERVYLKN
jgi:cytochrome c oxidase assembly protein subunit 15